MGYLTAFNRDDLNPGYRPNIIMYQLLQLADGRFEENGQPRLPIDAKEEEAMALARRHREEWEWMLRRTSV